MTKLNVLSSTNHQRLPSWLRTKLPNTKEFIETTKILQSAQLPTVCEEAKCPNRFECYSKKTATFLALGKTCTRACGFCDIDFAKKPALPAKDEGKRIAHSIQSLQLKHVVITMVARDDLPLGGAKEFASIIMEVKKRCPQTTIEVLTSDFSINFDAIDLVMQQAPTIFNHNIETVQRLSRRVRHKASYEGSLAVLKRAKQTDKALYIKSGIMVGLGEEPHEVKEAMKDLKNIGCDIITIGQYLQASKNKFRVKEFVDPKQFKEYEIWGQELGMHIYSGPFVRSSYNASELFEKISNLHDIDNAQ